MTREKKLLVFIFVVFVATLSARAQDISHLTLIAHYPLTINADDTTGNYGPMNLTNTPFQDGGIYCNGVYMGSGLPNFCHAFTPTFTDLTLEDFAVQVTFRIDTAYSTFHSLIMGGTSCRWATVWLQSAGVIGLYDIERWTPYALNTWQTVTLMYDTTSKMLRLFLDDVLADSSYEENLDHHDEKNFSITNGGLGRTYKGLLKDLKVYSYIEQTGIAEDPASLPEDPFLLSNYPNPFNPETTVGFSLPEAGKVFLGIYDTQGREVLRLIDGLKRAGRHTVVWNGRNLHGSEMPSGIYICRLRTPEGVRALKINLCR